MNDKELNKNVKKSFENFIKELATNPEKVFDNDKLQIKYNNVLKEKIKLQFNWNSLREYTEQHLKILERRINTFGTINPDKDTKVLQIYQDYLDKMNELEGKDKE